MFASRQVALLTLAAGMFCTPVHADDIYGLKAGRPELSNVAAMSFGPDGILFVGDTKAGKIFAIQTQDKKQDVGLPAEIPGVNQQIAKSMSAVFDSVKIADLAANPETGNVFIAAQVEGKAPRIFRLNAGEPAVTELDLSNVPFASMALPNAAEDKDIKVGNRSRNNRGSAITDLAFVNGQLIVAGLSNRDGASNVWSIQFPFREASEGAALEYYHGAHGAMENHGPIRTFVPFIVDGEPSLLAGFVCTPLVRFPLASLEDGAKKNERVQGTTLAELGNRNQPLDMIAYKKDGKDYLLLANSARGVMKINTENMARAEGINAPVQDGKTAGQDFEKVESLSGVVQLDKLNENEAVVLIQEGKGPMTLKIIELP